MCQGATDFQRTNLATAQDQTRTGNQRTQVERLMARAAHLPAGDRILLHQVYELGLKPADIAKAAQSDRQIIYRRIRALLRRLADPLYLYVVAHFETLSPAVQPVAKAIVLHGHTQRQAAKLTGQTTHQVRSHLLALRALAQREARIGFNRH